MATSFGLFAKQSSRLFIYQEQRVKTLHMIRQLDIISFTNINRHVCQFKNRQQIYKKQNK